LKSSLTNMDSNPLTQSGGMKGSLSVSADQWVPSTSFWEAVEVARRSSAVGSRRIWVMKSQSSCLYLASRV